MYEINVSKDGFHYFATHERSVSTYEGAMSMVRHFREVFPESKGYEVSVCERAMVSNKLDLSELFDH